MKVRYEIREDGDILGLKGVKHPHQLRDRMAEVMGLIGFYVQDKSEYIVMYRDDWLYLLPKDRMEYFGYWKIPFDFVEEAMKGEKVYTGRERSRGLQYFYVPGALQWDQPHEEFLTNGHKAAKRLGETIPDEVLGFWRI